jgi:glycerate 2-kinase
MKLIIAPDKFKGSCPADKVAAAIARGWKSFYPMDEAVLMPVADGGEGMLAAMLAACGGQYMELTVPGPLGNPVNAQWLHLDGNIAIVEMAQSSGLNLVEPERRDVRRADTYGTGQVIKAALDAGCRQFIAGVGGSATNDGGMGLLRALGIRFWSETGELTAPGDLLQLRKVDFSGFDSRIKDCDFTVACDVANPLCGPEGATAIYGPQKGATTADVHHMDLCLQKLAEETAQEMKCDKSGNPGAGAAGGLGWALMQCCGAKMKPGIDVVLDAAGFDSAIEGAGLVITGEGSMDGQTAMGKVPVGVAARVAERNIPVAVIAGRLGDGHEEVFKMGIDCAIGITTGPMALAEAMDRAEELIEKAAVRLARIINAGRRVERSK